ncbi:MAG: Hint domain-containing protein [Bacteroidetes bacterium]|nr:Hint domain-containing protein [Bacteroidota bacterium]
MKKQRLFILAMFLTFSGSLFSQNDCLTAGTKILMADNSLKNIELIQKGDSVKSYNFKTKTLINTEVTKLIIGKHTYMYILDFKDNSITTTADHPFWTKKGWATLFAKIYNPELDIGNKIFMPEKKEYCELLGVTAFGEEPPILMYSLELSQSDNFIANGLLVKAGEGKK